MRRGWLWLLGALLVLAALLVWTRREEGRAPRRPPEPSPSEAFAPEDRPSPRAGLRSPVAAPRAAVPPARAKDASAGAGPLEADLRVEGGVLDEALRPATGAIDVELRTTTDAGPPLARVRCGIGGRYALAARLPEAVPPEARLALIAVRRDPPAVSPATILEPGRAAHTRALRLREGAVVTAVVREAGGDALPEAEVVLLLRRAEGGSVPGWRSTDHIDVLRTVVADAAGWLHAVVRPGRMILRARRAGGPLGPRVEAQVGAGSSTHLGTLTAGDAWRHLRVRIVDPRGVPIAGSLLLTTDPALGMERAGPLRPVRGRFFADDRGEILLPMPETSAFPLEIAAAAPGHGPAARRLERAPPEEEGEATRVVLTLEPRPAVHLSLVPADAPDVPLLVAPASCGMRPLGGREGEADAAEAGGLLAALRRYHGYTDRLLGRNLQPQARHVLHAMDWGEHRIGGLMPSGLPFEAFVQLVPDAPPPEVRCVLPAGRRVTLVPVGTASPGQALVRRYGLRWIPSEPTAHGALECGWDARAETSEAYWVPRGVDRVQVRPPPGLGLAPTTYVVPPEEGATVAVALVALPLVEVTLQLVDERGPLALGGVPVEVHADAAGFSASGCTTADGTLRLALPPGRHQASRSATLARPAWVAFQVEANSPPTPVSVPFPPP